ncbi:hypothetical protein [Tersicoccus phoenicis]|uniref:hypothetical protein n=1 Tax=Tersicoccus phoenicis TaxID=554083 RepID=UPI00117C70EF|nr:hypothetical protein [Tersicoccus phoenicis]
MILLVTGVALSGCSASTGRPGDSSRGPRSAGAHFRLFDNTYYRDSDLSACRTSTSYTVYESRVMALTGQTSAKQELALPDRAAYQSMLRRAVDRGGPVILDFETLYLKGARHVAERRYDKLKRFLTWTRQVFPNRIVGVYGVLGNTDPAHRDLAKALAPLQDAFFPTLYTTRSSFTAWRAHLDSVRAEAQRVDPAKRIYPFIWPQFHAAASPTKALLPRAMWRSEVEAVAQTMDGAVVWSGARNAGSSTWARDTCAVMSTTA